MGGGSDINEAASRLQLPVDLLEDADDFSFDGAVYQDNALPVSIFTDMLTQWRTGGMGGMTGLDYNALRFVMVDIRKVPPEDIEDVFDCIRIMESAALRRMREVKK